MIRKLSNEELIEIYHLYMENDFPDNELKPLDMLLNIPEAIFYGLFENGLKGYAVILSKGDYAILDYLGTINEYRSQGYGSQLLQGVMELHAHQSVIIESEKPYDTISQKRIQFYLKNKLILSPCSVNLYFVDYHILSNHLLDHNLIEAIYSTFYPKQFRDQYLKID